MLNVIAITTVTTTAFVQSPNNNFVTMILAIATIAEAFALVLMFVLGEGLLPRFLSSLIRKLLVSHILLSQ